MDAMRPRFWFRLRTAGAGVAALALLAPAHAGTLTVAVNDAGGAAGRAGAPVCRPVALSRDLASAAARGRLCVRERRGRSLLPPVPAQFQAGAADGGRGRIWWILPPGPAGERTFVAGIAKEPAPARLWAGREPGGGQLLIRDAGRPVLRYNYETVQPGARFEAVTEPNRIYARARSDYIHPLYGPDGEVLTKDFALDHPHHRGIYWAWPEVDYRGERGDLHALQRVFARPTGRYEVMSGPVYAEIDAESVWMWDDREPIVRERAVIRAYRAGASGRVVDLWLRFTALADAVALARRGTEHYGGLNVRLAPVAGQQIQFHTDPAGSAPRRAWAVLSGTFEGGRQPAAITIFQKPDNPGYPGDWVQYPELNWFQPTFPAAKTRHLLRQGESLVLEYRIWIRPGGPAPDDQIADQWQAYAATPPICEGEPER